MGIWSSCRQAISQPRIELSLALFWTFMNGNFWPVTLFSYFKEMTSGCETFLLVFNLSNVKVYIHRTDTCTFSICITNVRRKDRQ